MALNKHQRLRKLIGAAAAYVADMDALRRDINAAAAGNLPALPDSGRRSQILSFREDSIYREARSLGVTSAIFMWAVDERATGPLSPKGFLRTISADLLAESRSINA